jgi:hypothetical protein
MATTDTPAELVTYRGGSHHFFKPGRPSHRKDMLTRLTGWQEKRVEQPLRCDTSSPARLKTVNVLRGQPTVSDRTTEPAS